MDDDDVRWIFKISIMVMYNFSRSSFAFVRSTSKSDYYLAIVLLFFLSVSS